MPTITIQISDRDYEDMLLQLSRERRCPFVAVEQLRAIYDGDAADFSFSAELIEHELQRVREQSAAAEQQQSSAPSARRE